jgi:hypothetical protein
MKLSTLTALALLLASPAFAQSVPLQSGPVTPGHAPMYVNTGSGQPIVTDGGGAANGAIGKNLSELGITARSPNNAYPVANGGKGALNSHFCMYDAPSTNATGYHFLCMEPNAQGGGLLSYGASGTAAPLPLYFDINGVTTVAGGTSTLIAVGSTFVTSGTSGQLLYDKAGVLGGLTVGGDATLNTSTGALTVTETNGTPFGALATLTPGNGVPTALQENWFPTNTGSFAIGNAAGTAIAALGTYQYDTVVGYGALSSASLTSSATNLTVFGAYAMQYNTTGNQNDAFGGDALKQNTTGSANSAFGEFSLQLNTTGSGNTALGAYSLYNATTAAYNLALGLDAGHALTTGSYNVLIGYNTGGTTLKTGSNNILICTGATLCDTAAAGTSDTLGIFDGSTAWMTGTAGNTTNPLLTIPGTLTVSTRFNGADAGSWTSAGIQTTQLSVQPASGNGNFYLKNGSAAQTWDMVASSGTNGTWNLYDSSNANTAISVAGNTEAATFFGPIIASAGLKYTNLAVSATAPTFTSGACAGAIGTANGTAAFTFTTGSGSCGNTATIGMPAATTGWVCDAFDEAIAGGSLIKETSDSPTQVVLTTYTIGTTPAAGPFTASHTVKVKCAAY